MRTIRSWYRSHFTRPDDLHLAEALAASDRDPNRLLGLAAQLDASAALRRIGSLADQLGLAGVADELESGDRPGFDLDLDPGLKDRDTAFRDRKWRIRWPVDPGSVRREMGRHLALGELTPGRSRTTMK